MSFQTDPGITDAECANFTERLEDRYGHADMAPGHPLRDTFVDVIGYTRWESSYVVKRQTGHTHDASTNRVLNEIWAIEQGKTLQSWEPDGPVVIDPGITDAECTDFTEKLEAHYAGEGRYTKRRTRVDVLGVTRWETSYVVKRQTGQSHEDATRAVLAEIDAIVGPPAPTPVPPGPSTFTKAQLMDLQGDLMIYCPELGLDWSGDVEPTTGIRSKADNGATPNGIHQGWFWTLWIWLLPPAKRQLMYAAIKRSGFTHCAISVEQQQRGTTGYHGLRPLTDAEVDNYGAAAMAVHAELLAQGIIPVCAGVAPVGTPGGAALAPGFDANVALVAMPDWDDSNNMAGRIKAVHDAFPKALVYCERLGPNPAYPQPDGDANDPIPPTATNGGAWLRAVQQAWPRFVGVLYEVSNSDGLTKCVAELTMCNAWWRDVQQVRFETNTYQKFWDGGVNYDVFEAQLQAACPWLAGFMSGGVSHTPPPTPGGQTIIIPNHDDKLTVTFVDPDISSFAKTANLTRVELRTSGVYVEFDKSGTWPDTPDRSGSGGMGPLQFSMGLALNIGGQWFASAPIELWRGLQESGGQIQAQSIPGFPGRGQIEVNWFYDARWSPLNGHQPKPGETVGFFVVAGDARNGVFVVQERSEIVAFPLPNDGDVLTLVWQ